MFFFINFRPLLEVLIQQHMENVLNSVPHGIKMKVYVQIKTGYNLKQKIIANCFSKIRPKRLDASVDFFF